MKQLLQLEQIAQMAAAIAAHYFLPLHLSWWVYLLLFIAPDLSMIGYMINTKIGAWTYNLVHHKALAAIVLITGLIINDQYLLLAGLMLWAHSSFDRILGYGLKYKDSFNHTHLGKIGKEKSTPSS